MDQIPDNGSPSPRRTKEYEDPHYHDDVDIDPVDDTDRPRDRPSVKRKLPRRPPKARRYDED